MLWGNFIWYSSTYNSNSIASRTRKLKLRHLNFDPYPSRTRTGLWVTLVATHAIMRMSLFLDDGNDWEFTNDRRFGGVSVIKWNSYPTIL